MKQLIIVILIIGGLYLYLDWKPSGSRIAADMDVGEVIIYQGKVYTSDWAMDSEEIEGFLRRKDRHYDKNMPVITYDLILTTGEFSDPEIVKLRNKGGGNYYWRAKKQPEGTLVVYHSVPSSPEAQNGLDRMEQGKHIVLVGSISQNNEIRSNSGEFVKLMHGNHKFILLEKIFER